MLQNKNIDDNFEKPEVFREKLKTLDEKLPPILDDFKKYYVFFNKNPEYPEYQNIFENVKNNLNSLNSYLFVLSNEVDVSTDKINEKLIILNNLINHEKEKNRELKKELGIADHKNNAAIELIYDYKQIYKSEYLRNWSLFFCIIIIGMSISKTNNNKIIINNNK
jgi:hypothetical protein